MLETVTLCLCSLFDHVNRSVTEHGPGPLPNGGEPLPD